MNYQQIIETLKKQGKITEEDITKAVDAEEEEIRAFATLLHSLICNERHIQLEEHAVGMEGCEFYAEEQMDNTWGLTKHRRWLDVVKRMIVRDKNIMTYDKNRIVSVCSAIALYKDEHKLFDIMFIELSSTGLIPEVY